MDPALPEALDQRFSAKENPTYPEKNIPPGPLKNNTS